MITAFHRKVLLSTQHHLADPMATSLMAALFSLFTATTPDTILPTMQPQILASACTLYQTSPDRLLPLRGGHYNAVYEYPFRGSKAILRIGVQDCPLEQTLGMLEWVQFLSTNAAPVCAPVRSAHHNLLETIELEDTCYVLTAFEKADGILAEDIPPAQWTDDLFQNIGRSTGRLHHASRQFVPSSSTRTRPLWHESQEIQNSLSLLGTAGDPAREQLIRIITELKNLPIDPTGFGLIHDDLHFANFLVSPLGQVTIVDFDDCAYGWFAMDIAMALFDVMVLADLPDETSSKHFAAHFLRQYLRGYRAENELPWSLVECIPQFLKFKELCIYASLVGHPDIDQPGTWVGRFMRERSVRIANGIPYVELDFSSQDPGRG
jgi:Ser/Thr protein kinase RdoA (MazF antagonist)